MRKTSKTTLTAKAIREVADKPEKLAELLAQHKLSEKHHRQRDEEYRDVLARAHLALTVIERAPNCANIFSALRKLSGSKTADSRASVLRMFIDYDGMDQRQYLSRDKAVLSLMSKERVSPRSAADFIKDTGGLQVCAQKYRDTCRGERQGRKDAKKKARKMADLIPWVAGADGHLVIVIARLKSLKGKRFEVLRSSKLPAPLQNKAARKAFWETVKATIATKN